MSHSNYRIKKAQQVSLEFFNAIGLIFKDYIFLTANNKLIWFEVEEIRQMSFKKNRVLTYNYVIFFLSFMIVIISFTDSRLSDYRNTGFALGGILLIYALIKKTYQYTIQIITTEHNVISIIINKENKKQATQFIQIVKGKINQSKQFLKVS
jgi:hypothetical protein